MADSKISALPASTTPLAGTETLPIVQSGVTKKVAVDDLTAGRSPSMNYAILNNGLSIKTSGINRWLIQKDGSDDLYVYRYDNAGAYAGNPMTISRSNGQVRFENGVYQGTAGTGFNFTANTPLAGMTSQLLNWYEEGTFTATLTAATVPTTPPTTTARYTRVGRQVTVSMTFDAANTSGASGAMKITGLPFTPASTAVSTYLSFQFALGGYPIAVIFSGSTDIFFYYTASNADWATQSITAGAGKYLYLSLTYTV